MGMCGWVDFVLCVREDGEPGVGTRGRICLTWVKKNQAWDMSSRETRINVYKFSG